jgi:hypothetical protein
MEENVAANLIGPDALEADAVVPQCLDNQFVSDAVFEIMAAQSLDYRDATIAGLREKEFKREFIRSIIYSSQVVIQRAYLTNSDFLFKNFLPDDNKNFNAFANLVRSSAIVPFLFTEKSLRENLQMGTNPLGERAVKALLDELGDDIKCLRLAAEDNECARLCAAMATDFGSGLGRLNYMDDEQRNMVASELFLKPERLQEPGAFEAFNAAIDSLVDYATKKGREKGRSKKHLSRSDIYQDNFAADVGDAVVNGRFKRRSENSFLFELKKYVDLVYNTNLPDRLKRYTFTPENMPSRLALQDAPGTSYRPEMMNAILLDKEAIEYAQRAFMAHSQKAMSLPLLSDLTVADVEEIRRLPEWKTFTSSQTNVLHVLGNSSSFSNKLRSFEEDFDQFQRALSKWYHSKYERARVEERYCNYVSIALNVAGQVIVAGSHLDNYEKAAARMAVPFIIDNIPKKVKGYAVKLMVNVYDVAERKLDADRSYSVELMQTNLEHNREDIIELVRSISSVSKDALPPAFGHFADQGIM